MRANALISGLSDVGLNRNRRGFAPDERDQPREIAPQEAKQLRHQPDDDRDENQDQHERYYRMRQEITRMGVSARSCRCGRCSGTWMNPNLMPRPIANTVEVESHARDECEPHDRSRRCDGFHGGSPHPAAIPGRRGTDEPSGNMIGGPAASRSICCSRNSAGSWRIFSPRCSLGLRLCALVPARRVARVVEQAAPVYGGPMDSRKLSAALLAGAPGDGFCAGTAPQIARSLCPCW